MQLVRPKSHPKLALLSILVLVLSAATLVIVQPSANATTSNLQSPVSNIQYPVPDAQETATTTVHIPLIMRNHPLATDTMAVMFGTEFAPFEEEEEARYADVVEHDLPLVQRAGFTSLRTHIYWREIEPENTTPENFDWTRYDQRLQDYAERGFDSILGIVAYPRWATKFACGGGMLDGAAPEWREFVRAAAERYSQPPYDVHIWEIGNEVDGETEVEPEDADRPPPLGHLEPTWPFGGCWGDIAPQYVEFLRIAYEEIKAVDPDATVMLGGLAYAEFDHWFMRDFLDNFLAAGGGEYTDVLGFHWFKSFQADWPSAVDKARELRETMAAHGIDKPMWLTETWMPDRILDTDNRQERYRFITQDLPRAVGTGEVLRVYWFAFSDWPEGWSDFDRGLVDREHQPKPGLKLFEIMTEFVDGVASPVTLAGVEAYRFRRPWTGDDNWVMWPNNVAETDTVTQTVTIPTAGTTAEALRIELGDTYTTTRPILVDVEIDEDGVHVPVGPDTVFVRIRHENQ